MQKTYHPKPGDVPRLWYVVDASGQNLGRLASRIARALTGKDKPQFTPGVDVGDFVVVVNAEKVQTTGKKLDEKFYFRHSMYPGGGRRVSLREQLARHPERVIEAAVWGMLPRNRLRHHLFRKLRVYAGPSHPHSAQEPRPLA